MSQMAKVEGVRAEAGKDAGATRFRAIGILLGILLTCGVAARAGTVHGTVKNGTTGKPGAGVEVILIQLQGGMQPVANSKADAEGQFTFDNPSLGAQPMLIRAVYRGVNFHQPVPPGKNEVEVEVFDPTQNPKTVTIPAHIVILQPNGSTLIVGEEYSVVNNSNPKQAYFRADGNFEFALPDKAQLQQAAAWGPSGMPVVQAPIDKPKNHYAVAFAFRPGESGVRYSYELPYAANTATLKLPTLYPGAKLIVLAAPSVQITGEGLQPGGQEQGMTVYGRESLPANDLFTVNVSGTAPPPNAQGDANGGGPGQEQQGGGIVASPVTVTQIPGRLDVLKWPLVAGFVGLFALGAILLVRKPVVAVAGGAPHERANSSPLKKKATTAKAAMTATAESSTANLAEVDAAVSNSLDSLKDQIFRLELRRQAGTISEEEYAQERARTEKVLRDLVRG
jgi:hypothetical protein